MNASIIDILDEIALALFEMGYLLPDTTVQATIDDYSP
jgi:hypothetical protein